jgi:hypothetical protein
MLRLCSVRCPHEQITLEETLASLRETAAVELLGDHRTRNARCRKILEIGN